MNYKFLIFYCMLLYSFCSFFFLFFLCYTNKKTTTVRRNMNVAMQILLITRMESILSAHIGPSPMSWSSSGYMRIRKMGRMLAPRPP